MLEGGVKDENDHEGQGRDHKLGCFLRVYGDLGQVWGAEKTDELERRLANLEGYIQGLPTQLTDFSKGIYSDLDQRMKFAADKVVGLNIVSKQFSKVETNAGDFLLAVDQREKTANGYRLVLKIGNPHSATYSNFKLRLFWGKNWDPSFVKPSYEEWRGSLVGAEYSFAGPAEPGVWTPVTVDLVAPAGQPFEYLECEMSVGAIELQMK